MRPGEPPVGPDVAGEGHQAVPPSRSRGRCSPARYRPRGGGAATRSRRRRCSRGGRPPGTTWPSSAFRAASSLSTWEVDCTLSSWAWMSSTGVLEVGQRAGREQLVDGAGPGLHAGDLVLGPLHRRAGVAHRRRDAGDRLADLRLRLGRGVAGLHRLLLGAELLDLRLEPLGGGDELLLLLADLVVLGLQVGQLLAEGSPAGERLPGEILVALGRARPWPGPGACRPASGAGRPGARSACGRSRRRRRSGGPSGGCRAASRTTGRASREGPRACREPCSPWPGRCSWSVPRRLARRCHPPRNGFHPSIKPARDQWAHGRPIASGDARAGAC